MALVSSSALFVKNYSEDFDLMFRMSAKKDIEDNEIAGPTVFKKTKDVEYTIFLPFDVISKSADVPRAALRYLLKGVCSILSSLDIDTMRTGNEHDKLIEEICSDPQVFK